jgi:uncharacterized protein (DUF885 family)
MTRFLYAASLTTLMSVTLGCSGRDAPTVPATQQSASIGSLAGTASGSPGTLVHTVERYWDAYLELNPTRATATGDHRYDDRLENSISPQYLADSLALERRSLAELLMLSAPPEHSPARLTYEVFKRERERAIEGYTYPEELFPLDPVEGMAQNFALMGSGEGPQPFVTAKDYDNWLRRTDAFALWARQAIDNLRSGMRRGYLAPRGVVEAMLPQLAQLGEDGAANPFFGPRSNLPATLDGAQRASLEKRFDDAIKTTVLPAYRGLHDFLQSEYLPLAPEQGAWSRLPLGDAWYAYLVRRQSSTELTPAQVRRLSLAEVERLRGRVQAVLNDVGFSGTASAYFEQLRRDPNNAHGTVAALLGAYRDLQARVDAAAPAVLAGLPIATPEIRAAAHFREFSGVPLIYRGATADGNFPATLIVNTSVASRFGLQIEPLLLNAYLPGRHAQYTLQLAAPDLPKFRRFGSEPAFVEGWGLYAESLGEEMGLVREPAAKFAALLDELSHAAIAVIDCAMHADAWTRATAIEYLRAQSPLDAQSAGDVIDRILARPARALAAEVGALRISALRTRAQERLGSRFDLRAFHTAILDQGALPLDLLEQRVDRWIDAANAETR